MTQKYILTASFMLMLTAGGKLYAQPQSKMKPEQVNSLVYPNEKHFANIRQLTFGGDNAEAYFSFDGKHIVFQRTHPAKGIPCDQIRSEEHTSELQSRENLVCRLLLEKKKNKIKM